MANKEFKIQSDTISLNGVPLSSSVDGSVVIPGVTRATGYRVEEVEDTDDQTYNTYTNLTVIDYVTYTEIAAGGNGSGRADYTAELDDDGYMDNLEVAGRGSYTAQEATDNANNDMYAYIGTGTGGDRPIVPQDWIQIPFRPKMKSTGIESEFGSGGGASNLEDLDDVQLDGPSEGQVLTWNDSEEKWENRDPSGGGDANTGNIVFEGDTLTNPSNEIINLEASNYVQLQSGENYIWVDNQEGGAYIQVGDKTFEFDDRGALRLPEGGDIIDSNGNTVLGGVNNSYTPETESDWDTVPSNIQAALDELAARVTALQNFEIDGGNAYTPAAGELLIDGNNGA